MHLHISLPTSAKYLRWLIREHFLKKIKMELQNNENKWRNQNVQSDSGVKPTYSILSVNLNKKENVFFNTIFIVHNEKEITYSFSEEAIVFLIFSLETDFLHGFSLRN